MTVRPLGECALCKHQEVNGEGVVYCDAFPAGVPHEIIYGQFDHRVAHPGQESPELFVPKPGTSKQALAGVLDRFTVVPSQ